MKIETVAERGNNCVRVRVLVDDVDCGCIIVAASPNPGDQIYLDKLLSGEITLSELQRKFHENYPAKNLELGPIRK